MILNAYQELLNRSYSLVDEKQIERIGNYLNATKKVIVCGKGSSGLAAREMEIRFMRIGVDVDSITDTDLMRMQAVFQNENSEGRKLFYLLRIIETIIKNSVQKSC